MSSIPNAFNISRTGLTMTSHWAQVVSGNIANADDPSYGRRTLDRVTYGGGTVHATAIRRQADQSLARMYREELANMTREETIASGIRAYTTSLGSLDDPNSPAQLLTEFQTSLDFLFNDPAQTSLQQATLQSAEALTRGLNRLSGDLDSATGETLQRLRADLSDANEIMEGIAKLNVRVTRAEPGTELYATLKDQQDAALNRLAEYMDIRVEPGAEGTVDIYTQGGMRLLEGDTAQTLEFDRATGVLTAGGEDITPPRVTGVNSGRLAGHAQLWNETLPRMRLQIDELARSIIVSFEDADASLGPGDAGLFTDGGLAYDPASLTGLAGRIAVNDLVIPENGGALWRLRDGLGTVLPDHSGNTEQLGAFIDAMDAPQTYDPGTTLPSDITLADYVSSMIADQRSRYAAAEKDFENFAASAGSIDDARLNAQGVNIDDELQQLLMVEKSYAANSQVVSTLSNMLDTLLAVV